MNKLTSILSAAVTVTLTLSTLMATAVAQQSAGPLPNAPVPPGNNVTPKLPSYGRVNTVIDLNPEKMRPSKGYTRTTLPPYGPIKVDDIIAATDNSLDIQKAISLVSNQRHNYLVARDEYYPQLFASASPVGLYGIQRIVYSATATQNIFNWNQLKTIKAQRFQLDSQVFNALTEKQQIQFLMVRDFYEVLKAKSAVNAQQTSVKALRDTCEYIYQGQGTKPDVDPCTVVTGSDIPAKETHDKGIQGGGIYQRTDLDTAAVNLLQAVQQVSQLQLTYQTVCHDEASLIGIQNDYTICDRFQEDAIPDEKTGTPDAAAGKQYAFANRPDLNAQRATVKSEIQTASSFNTLSRFNLIAEAGSGNLDRTASLYSSGAVGSTNYPGSSIGIPVGSQSVYVGLSLTANLTPQIRQQNQAAKALVRYDEQSRDRVQQQVAQSVDDSSSTIHQAYTQYNLAAPLINYADLQLIGEETSFKQGLVTTIDLALVITNHAVYQAEADAAKFNVAEALAQYKLVIGQIQ